jgi:hypothetical protein
MPPSLTHLASAVTTGFSLVALICVVIAWGYIRHLRHQENIIRSTTHKDRRRVIDIVLSHFSIDSSNLSQDQQFKLAIAQIHGQRWKIGFWGLCAVLVAVVSAYAIKTDSRTDQASVAAPIGGAVINQRAAPAPPREGAPGDIVLPFALRAISPATLTDELAGGGEVSILDSCSARWGEITRDGDLFLVRIRETDHQIIKILGYSGSSRVIRTIAMSGYTAAHVPCDFRAIYLPAAAFNLSDSILKIALEMANSETSCSSVDKGLVVWNQIRDAANSLAYPNFTKYKPLIQYNWARQNYKACTALGYDEQCRISQEAFAGLSKVAFGSLGLTRQLRDTIIEDIETIPLRISYTRLRTSFGSRDYLASAKLAEDLLANFDANATQWDKLSISKSRLYADAAVSWLHYADSLAPVADLDHQGQRCESYERALYFARRALWFNFRQDHVPLIERRISDCR